MNYSCVNIVTVLNLGILLIVFVTRIRGFQTSEVNQTSSDDCWSNANFTCVKAMILDPIKDIWNKKEIRVINSVVIEKIPEVSSDDYGTRGANATEESRGHDGDAERMMENVGTFLKTHALRFDLWNIAKLRIQRSQDNPESLEIIFDMNRGTPNDNGEAKGKDMWKVIVPLVVGFKSTGALIFAISSVKLFLLKALMVSKVALLATAFLMVKRLLGTVGVQHQPHSYAPQPLPYHQDHALDGGFPSAYGYYNYITAGGYHNAATGHDAHGYGASASGTLAATEADDLQAHFSNNVATSVQTEAKNGTTTRKDGTHQRVFRPVKSHLNRIPVITYRKVVDKGRSS